MTIDSGKYHADDDGLVCPEVGGWAETKYRLIALYDALFATGMKKKWGQRVYIDLYSAAGHSKVRGTQTHLMGSPILALTTPDPFDKYIFCEESSECLDALKSRVKNLSPKADVTYISGSCDEKVEEICHAIPKGSKEDTVLSLCVVDPFDFGMKFKTLSRLSHSRVDFLVLLAVHMDARRAYDHYVDGTNTKLDEALGNTDWRNRWAQRPRGKDEFPTFLAEEFALRMTTLGYLPTKPSEMKLVRSEERNTPLYYLALFSKHKTAYQFWNQVLKYHTDQTSFSWEI
jgi:three-Cys-motif partner protein